ncbi:DUF5752 family protein [Methylocaldum sp.]|uniref:DUF5752 family protein n=1 Tax=Methylocaldum sp. TaxID=1969727 RepID=UPI002D27A746|nr:DUF5752 family protein [Methylocaldum sp.]HYE35175.1 DUF5752 family protein [Methylocaldum sp.]
MDNQASGPMPFIVNDCALLAIATGKRAQNLKELRDHLLTIHPGSIYFHFWGNLLQPRFDEPEYNNDFAAWSMRGLHDKALAERLSVVDPNSYGTLDELRQELIDVIEQRLDEREVLAWAQPDQQFEFIRALTVVFRTDLQFFTPEKLAGRINQMSVSSIFYHFIDAKRRNENRLDDFRNWLVSFEGRYEGLSQSLAQVDPYFTSLTDLREELADIFSSCLCEMGHG